MNPKAKERVGYPTQKPILLLDKIIELVTDEGDTVLDPFCGSGTTLVAAQFLNRKYIGIDLSKQAIELSNMRLKQPIKTESKLLNNGKNSYINQDPSITSILSRLQITPVQRNKGIDGFLKIEGSVRPIPVKIQRDYETLEEAAQLLLQAGQRIQYPQRILIKKNSFRSNELFTFSQNFPKDLIIIDNVDELDKEKLMSNIK